MGDNLFSVCCQQKIPVHKNTFWKRFALPLCLNLFFLANISAQLTETAGGGFILSFCVSSRKCLRTTKRDRGKWMYSSSHRRARGPTCCVGKLAVKNAARGFNMPTVRDRRFFISFITSVYQTTSDKGNLALDCKYRIRMLSNYRRKFLSVFSCFSNVPCSLVKEIAFCQGQQRQQSYSAHFWQNPDPDQSTAKLL